VRVRKEQREEAYLAYKQAVLKALEDSEDALLRYDAEQRRLKSLKESQAAAASSLHISKEQYRAGLVPFINVLTAQSALLTAQDEVAQSEQAFTADLVSIYKALGGGWSTDTPDRAACPGCLGDPPAAATGPHNRG
jgi:outer membrane protein TolC